MTYPPPPGGAPGDPYGNPQQPGDPYGQPGGYGPPPGDPYGQPGGYGPPPGDPYGQPQVDPYTQPPADPYGQPADPYSAPPGDPYGQQPDPYSAPPMHQQPGMAPQGMPPQQGGFMPGAPAPQQKSNLGWILGGVFGVLVILGAVVTFVILGTGGGDSTSADGGGDSDGGSGQGEDGGGEGGGGGDYSVDGVQCSEIDISAADSVGIKDFEGAGIDKELSCFGSSSDYVYSLSVTATVYGDADEAASEFDSKSSQLSNGKEMSGDFEQGVMEMEDEMGGKSVAQDGNMIVNVDLGLYETGFKASDGEKIVGGIAGSTYAACG